MTAVLLTLVTSMLIAWSGQLAPTVVKFEKVPSLTGRQIAGMNKSIPCGSMDFCARNCFGGVGCAAFSFSERNKICHLFQSDLRLLQANSLSVDIGTTVFVMTGLCPFNYIFVGGVCLRKSSSQKTYDEANVSCSDDGGELVQVKTGYLMNEIVQFMAVEDIHNWAGATDTAEEGTWSWNDGTPVSGWCEGEPNNQNGEDCLTVQFHDGVACLNDYGCTEAHFYICQVPSII